MIDERPRTALQELEDVPEPRAAELVLPFASRWVLPVAGLDLDGFPRVAAGLRRALEDAEVVDALAHRIAESVLPRRV